jgi:hypothetical protein
MDETQISITIKPIYIERLVYWIIILVLAVLLVICYTKDTAKSATVVDSTQTDTAAKPEQNAMPEPDPVPSPVASCSDAKKNQDETDIDCGGVCTKCISGKACAASSDCVSGICTSGTCTNAVAKNLSGKVEFDLTNVEFTKTASGTVKVTGISFKVTNGLDKDFAALQLQVYLKNKNNVYCINQLSGGDCDQAFAVVNLGKIASGKSATLSHTLESGEYVSGSFVRAGDYYNVGDQFYVAAFLYDSTGNLIDGKTISDAHQVKP